jgi:hypothetical protein
MHTDRALSEAVSVILIIVMIIILALVIAALVFGQLPFQKNSALVASEIKNQTLFTKNIITVFHRAGDEVYLNSSLTGMHEMSINIDNRTSTWRAQPVKGLNTVKPGTTLIIYYNASAKSYRITTNSAIIATNEAQPVADCPLRVRLVDETAHLLITTWNWTCVPVPLTGPQPTVSSMNATTGYRGWPITESIVGTYFLSGATAKFNRTGSPDIPSTSCTFVSSTRLNCTFDLANRLVSPPNYNIVVTNPDGKQGMRANYFTLSSPAPTVLASIPRFGNQAETVAITNLSGTNFQPGAKVDFYRGSTRINLTGVSVLSGRQITGSLVIPPTATSGLYTVSVTNPNSTTGTGNVFTVNSTTPSITARTPTAGNRGWPVAMTITGTNFINGATVRLNRTGYSDIPGTSVTVVSPTQINCTFNLAGASPGLWNLSLSNPDGRGASQLNYFTVNSPAPTISGSTPASGVNGTSVSITNLAGTNFQPSATVTYWRGTTVIPLDSIAVPLPTSITGSLPVPLTALAGTYNITVLNTDGRTVTRTNAFTVYAKPPPAISGIVPGTGARVTAVPVVVTGSNIQPNARVRLYNGTTAVYLAPVGTVSTTQISTILTVPLSVAPGTMNVRITNPDGQYATLTGGYILTL